LTKKKGFLKGKKNYETQFLKNNVEWQNWKKNKDKKWSKLTKVSMSNPWARLWDRENPIENKKKLMPNSINPNVKGHNKKSTIDKKVKKIPSKFK